MTDKHEDKSLSPAVSQHGLTSKELIGRRGLITKAAIVSPLAMAAMSKPAWGDLIGKQFRCGGSGMASGDASLRPEQEMCGGGYSPGYWGNVHGFCRWSSYHSKPFTDLFIHTSCSGEPYDYTGKTLAEIMSPNNSNAVSNCPGPVPVTGPDAYNGSLGWHAIAAWLNSMFVFGDSGLNYVFSTVQVLDYVQTVMGTGSVTIGGANYNCGQLKALFDSTY